MTIRRTTDPEEARGLLAGGARLRRVAHDMAAVAHAAGEPGEPPAGLRVEALGDPDELSGLSAGSTPPEHVDHAAWVGPVERAGYWRRLLAGEVCGPLLERPSARLVDTAGRTAGVLVATRMPPTSWWDGGAWVAEVFATPARQGSGVGSWLLRNALHQSAALGERRLGLTVTDRNPAERLYARLGFVRLRTVYILDLPDPGPA